MNPSYRRKELRLLLVAACECHLLHGAFGSFSLPKGPTLVLGAVYGCAQVHWRSPWGGFALSAATQATPLVSI